LPHERGRGGLRLPALPDPELRQGSADADQASRQRRADHAEPRAGGRGLRAMRWALIALVACGVLLAGAAPAAPPEYPVTFIKVEELKVLLDLGQRADIIDGRHWASFVGGHIRGARSLPLRAAARRAKEIAKTTLAVFY